MAHLLRVSLTSVVSDFRSRSRAASELSAHGNRGKLQTVARVSGEEPLLSSDLAVGEKLNFVSRCFSASSRSVGQYFFSVRCVAIPTPSVRCSFADIDITLGITVNRSFRVRLGRSIRQTRQRRYGEGIEGSGSKEGRFRTRQC